MAFPAGKWKGMRRFTMQSTSTDLLHWDPPHPVLTPNDSVDEGETQFYCMSGVLARGMVEAG